MSNLKSKTIKLTKRDLKKAEEFAKARIDHNINQYKLRGAFKPVDLICGALGEIAVYKLLKPSYKVSKPDFGIYEVRGKTFNPDLPCKTGELFHVKSQTTDSEARYGQSWVMQRTDPVINNPKEEDFLVPCVVDMNTLEVRIYGVMKFTDIVKHNLVGEMSIAWLQKTKRALYLEDLKALSAKKRWNLVLDSTI